MWKTSWFRLLISLSLLITCAISVPAAEVVRFYTLGEDDPNAAQGESSNFTLDTVEFQETADIGPTVDLEGFGSYVEGRDGGDSLAMGFNGATDWFEAPRFDPRDFGGSFTALSQAWVKPDSAGSGTQQRIWALGNDNGGAGITEDGFFELFSGGSAGSIVSTKEVEFDAWSHLAVLRGGNGARLYVNGSLVVTNDGFWNGPGTLYLGVDPTLEFPYHGAVDDFILSGFGDGVFDLINDIKFFDPESLSGVTGDVNQDSKVDGDDYAIWSSNIGFDNQLGVGDANTLFRGDVDQNGRVNFFDFDLIRREAAAAGVAIAIPEPGTGLLLVVGCFFTFLFRRDTVRRVR